MLHPTTDDAAHAFAVGDGVGLQVPATKRQRTTDKLEHLVDIQTGRVQPFTATEPDLNAVVDYLPQGVWLILMYSAPDRGHLMDWNVRAAGQTVYRPPNGDDWRARAVLQYGPHVTDPHKLTRTLLKHRMETYRTIGELAVQDPTISTIHGRTAVIDDSLDVEEQF